MADAGEGLFAKQLLKKVLSQAFTFLHFSKSFLSNTFILAFLLRPFFKLITTIKSFICFHSFSEGHTGSTLQWGKGKMLASVEKVDIEISVFILSSQFPFLKTLNVRIISEPLATWLK